MEGWTEMKYTETGVFPCHKIMNILQVLKNAPESYLVYAMYADSIYPITGVTDGAMDDTCHHFYLIAGME